MVGIAVVTIYRNDNQKKIKLQWNNEIVWRRQWSFA